jgi:hypothetical protein
MRPSSECSQGIFFKCLPPQAARSGLSHSGLLYVSMRMEVSEASVH